MKSFLDTFLFIFDLWGLLSTLLLFVGAFVLVYVYFKEPLNKKRYIKKGIILIGQFFLTIIISISLHNIFNSLVREELKDFLSQSDLKVIYRNSSTKQSEATQIIADLRKIHLVSNHKSSPIKNIKLVILHYTESIELSIAQDSEIENEYWVFWDKYKTTSFKYILFRAHNDSYITAGFNEVGRINSDFFRKENESSTKD